jgi:hypothetical protein
VGHGNVACVGDVGHHVHEIGDAAQRGRVHASVLDDLDAVKEVVDPVDVDRDRHVVATRLGGLLGPLKVGVFHVVVVPDIGLDVLDHVRLDERHQRGARPPLEAAGRVLVEDALADVGLEGVARAAGDGLGVDVVLGVFLREPLQDRLDGGVGRFRRPPVGELERVLLACLLGSRGRVVSVCVGGCVVAAAVATAPRERRGSTECSAGKVHSPRHCECLLVLV